MAASSFAFAGDRVLTVLSLDRPSVSSVSRPFVTLLPAFDEAERRKAEAAAGLLVERGCVEFCCVGAEAEQLHDSIDGMLEAMGAIDIVTTWHTDNSDACEYFLLAAGGRSRSLGRAQQ